ncbi:Putative disease resistance protein RGA3 [Triticum urartu]|uniref:Putative disease resistance protein RGA3 n=1 Tax=Triticum urartu TaxID=4572 RepID=M7YWG0_TRIUA|nr:Putative disease resistance protein RGA3 [Triticum urartu]
MAEALLLPADLRTAAYQADDVLDDFHHEALRREARIGESAARKVLGYFTPPHNPLLFRLAMSWRLNSVLKKIDLLVAEMNSFGLENHAEAPHAVLCRQTHSAIDDPAQIFGRDLDKEAVVNLLLGQQDHQKVQVLPVFGMGGLGKTTLAKMVYNDPKVQQHFQLLMWHCASDSFETAALVKSIIELATRGRCDIPDTVELLRGRLQEVIGWKRFLLVLDDVWNEEQRKWEDSLKSALCSVGGSGSVIIVTTRSPRAASIMGTLQTHELAHLSEQHSWELFSKKAFKGNVREQAELMSIGKRIVSKCKGHPLALSAMGGLMCSKGRAWEWEAIAESNIGDSVAGKQEIISILKLSYQRLSSEMKQCFAFCAVFSKNNSVCMLYNLQSLRLNHCHKLRYLPEGIRSMKKLHHLYLFECDKLEQMPPKISQLSNLHTLTSFVVGTGDGCGIDQLKDLKYLSHRLELYNLIKIESVVDAKEAKLYQKKNLTELSLCWGRRKYHGPQDDVGNMEEVLEALAPHSEIKVLEIHGYGGTKFSSWMMHSQMCQCLRKLIIFNCPKCKHLPSAPLLVSLEYLSLGYMDSLTMICKDTDVEVEGCNASRQIFPKLKRMFLENLPELERWTENSTAGEPPHSLVMFPLLEELRMYACPKVASVPSSPVIEKLRIMECYSLPISSIAHLTTLSELEFGGELIRSASMPLGSWLSLVKLSVSSLGDMMLPPGDQQSHRPLETLRSMWLPGPNCFETTSTLSKSHLLRLWECFAFVEELCISGCDELVHWPTEELRNLARLRFLRISFCVKLKGKGSPSDEILPPPQLEMLSIHNCSSLRYIPEVAASLDELVIGECTCLIALPSNLSKLRVLRIQGCSGLKTLPDGLTSLEQLTIERCTGIEKFPQDLLQGLPALKSLKIVGCPNLQRHCRQGGEYFHLISSIPHKDIPAAETESGRMNQTFLKRFYQLAQQFRPTEEIIKLANDEDEEVLAAEFDLDEVNS